MALDFGLSHLRADQLFIRYRPDTPGFVLHRCKADVAIVDRLVLHVDFPTAERDSTQNSVGPTARGTGVLQFADNRPPIIISREVERAGAARNIGFSLDVSSPYAVDDIAHGIGTHIFASSFVGAREAFAAAYEQYRKVTVKQYHGIPVFDCYGWTSIRRDDAVFHKPRLQLCGFTPSLTTPLSSAELATVNQLRTERMEQFKLYRPRMGVKVATISSMARNAAAMPMTM